jgi:hypothetical protein
MFLIHPFLLWSPRFSSGFQPFIITKRETDPFFYLADNRKKDMLALQKDMLALQIKKELASRKDFSCDEPGSTEGPVSFKNICARISYCHGRLCSGSYCLSLFAKKWPVRSLVAHSIGIDSDDPDLLCVAGFSALFSSD